MKTRAFFIAILMLTAAPGVFYPVPACADPASPAEQNVYSNETFVRLVKKYLSDDGDKIDYAAWKDSTEDLQALDRQVALLARVSPAKRSRSISYCRNETQLLDKHLQHAGIAGRTGILAAGKRTGCENIRKFQAGSR